MKRIYQYLVLTGLSGLLCLFLAIPADAQRGGSRNGGGGGGSRPSSGGGGGSMSGGSRGGGFSGGGARPGGNVTSGRPSGGASVGRPAGGYSGNRGQMHQPGNIASPRAGQSTNRAYSRGNSGVYGSQNRSYNNRVGIARGGNTYRGGNSNIARSYRGGRYTQGRNYAYRGYGNRSYGRSYGPWAGSRGYYYNRGFYRSLYYPRLGFNLGYLPYGYYPFYWGGLQFYYSNGYYYQYDNNQYTVVEPPVGAAINTLPDKAESIVINGEQYYELNGVYYQSVTKDDGTVVYEIAGKDGQLDTDHLEDMPGPTIEEPQVGDVVNTLPPDTRRIKLNGERYFVSPDEYYYQETRDNNGDKAYKVVGTPTDEPGN